jgi:ribonuclease P/MRP protein subunit POP5
MVRIKHRYLLVNILYPDLDNNPINSKLPDIIQINQPTTDGLTAQDLLKGIREEVDHLFGDYGAGTIQGSIGKWEISDFLIILIFIVKYWSPATSTFILRVSREHYRVAWAALSLMNQVPVRDGKKCVFKVVRVSGTIKKSQEEVIRRAREMIVKTRREMGEQSDSALSSIFGKGVDHAKADSTTKDILMVDRSDSERDEDRSDEDG